MPNSDDSGQTIFSYLQTVKLIKELKKWYNQIHIKPTTPKGETDEYNKAAIKQTDA